MKKAKPFVLAALALILILGGAFMWKYVGLIRSMREMIIRIERDVKGEQTAINLLAHNVGSSRTGSFDYSWLDDNVLVAHALGGIDGLDYTNSREALEQSYRDGVRVFECDMQLLDDRVVLMHDKDFFCRITGLDYEDLNYDSFRAAKIYGKYTPMDLDDVLLFMYEHKDAWFVTDSKYVGGPHSAQLLSYLAAHAEDYDESLLDRFIIQIYSEEMFDQIMSIYPFRSVIYTLYSSFDTDDEVIRFCLHSGVGAVTASIKRMTPEFNSRLHALGIHTLVHPVDTAEDAAALLGAGIDGVYFEFFTPDELDTALRQAE